MTDYTTEFFPPGAVIVRTDILNEFRASPWTVARHDRSGLYGTRDGRGPTTSLMVEGLVWGVVDPGEPADLEDRV